MKPNLIIKRVAVLGAGMMGAQIAAHFVNVGISVILFDFPSEIDDPNFLVKNSILELQTLNPNPFAFKNAEGFIEAANFKFDLEKIQNCDLIIENIADKIEWKTDLFKKILPFINEKAVLASHTDFLKITNIANNLPKEIKKKFVGLHFFNPPRYIKLIELVPHPDSDKDLLNKLEEFIVSVLGKGVVRVKDSPNFICNRVIAFFCLSVIAHAKKYNIPFDIADLLISKIIGNCSRSPFKTLDLMGLDNFDRIVKSIHQEFMDDPWHMIFVIPEWMSELINRRILGVKTNIGIYKTIDDKIFVFDSSNNDYRAKIDKIPLGILEIINVKNPLEKFRRLKESNSYEAKFLWSCIRDLLHYVAFHQRNISYNLEDVDLVLKWGQKWKVGPFELWQQAGWYELLEFIKHDISGLETLANVNMPDWTNDFGDKKEIITKNNKLSFYKKQLFPEAKINQVYSDGKTIFENNFLRLWTYDFNIAILSFKTNNNEINIELLESIIESIDLVEREYKALVLWQKKGNIFSFGFNLKNLLHSFFIKNDLKLIEDMFLTMYKAAFRMRNCKVPTCTAINGFALNDSLELIFATDKIVASLETYIGLPFDSINSVYLNRQENKSLCNFDLIEFSIPSLTLLFNPEEYISSFNITNSAIDAKNIGLLLDTDSIIYNRYEALFTALEEVKQLTFLNKKQRSMEILEDSEYEEYFLAQIKKTLNFKLKNIIISEYSLKVLNNLADILHYEANNIEKEINENWLLKMELENFVKNSFKEHLICNEAEPLLV